MQRKPIKTPFSLYLDIQTTMAELTKPQQQEVKKEVAKQVDQKVEKKVEQEVKKRSRLIENTAYVGSEFKHHTATAIMAAFGLIIALSWQTVIKKFIDNLPKSDIFIDYPYLADLYTAIVLTAISVFGILIISRWAKKPEK